MSFLYLLLLLLSHSSLCEPQSSYSLPIVPRYAQKPVVPPGMESFFNLNGSARLLVDSLLGEGFIPPRNFDVSGSGGQRQGGFFGNSLPGFQQGFSVVGTENLGQAPQFLNVRRAQTKLFPVPIVEDSLDEGSGVEPKSSIDGIPNVFPNLPKAPIPQLGPTQVTPPHPVVAKENVNIPRLNSRPAVPQGGLGPLATDKFVNERVDDNDNVQYPVGPSSENSLLDSVLSILGFNPGHRPLSVADSTSGLSRAISDIITRDSVGIGQRAAVTRNDGVIGNVLYRALTSGSIQRNDSKTSNNSLTLTKDQESLLGENLALIQQLITQPSSPLCNPKPRPLVDFRVDAFMGQWYQVLHSPPLSAGPCSMVAYKKLADVANGGPGTVFDTFEYSTDGTPYGRPKISSGYAIIRAPGELIYRTTTNADDVNVHVIHAGPVSTAGEYEYVVLSVNCNYPLHVFARDPVQYKQQYEAHVNAILEQSGLTNGFSRLLNIVAPVDSTLCNFPPTLFNIHG